MSHPPSTQHLTEIQTLSLLPDTKIGSWSSDARKALQVGLRTTASHPKCHGIYWLKKTEDPQKIVVISKWSEAVDLGTSRSYLRPLLLHLSSPPTRSIHVNHATHSFSSYSISNFLTFYFPIRYCSSKFKSQITANVSSFINSTEPTYSSPQSLRFVASGWIKETKMIDGEVANGFMFCLMWTDRKSEDRYKDENEHWRVLMRYLRSMGILGEEEYHGKAFHVLGEGQRERFEFSDDSSDEEEDMDQQLELMRQQLKKLAPACTPQLWGVNARTESDITRPWNRLDLLENPKCGEDKTKTESGIHPWSEQELRKMAVEDSDDESPHSTPILTPSSSTLSFNSLFDDSKSVRELPGTWKSEYDISRHQDGTMDDTSIAKPSHDFEDERTRSALPRCERQLEIYRDDEDHETNIGQAALEKVLAKLKSREATISTIPIQDHSPAAEKLQGILSLSPRRTQSSNHEEKGVPDLMRRYGVAKWDPEEELRNAKSRFWRRGKRLSAPTLERQRATLRDCSPPLERGRATERILTIDPLRNSGAENKRKSSWWVYVRDCLPSPASGSMVSTDVEAAVKTESTAAEEGTADYVTSQCGSHLGLSRKSTRDSSLPIEQMGQAKARPAKFF